MEENDENGREKKRRETYTDKVMRYLLEEPSLEEREAEKIAQEVSLWRELFAYIITSLAYFWRKFEAGQVGELGLRMYMF